jgi:acyl-CoA synthetase (AMP-forming)/AMP-acid ligase II
MEKQDRINGFYKFEELAKDSSSANRIFLLLPPDAVGPGEQSQWTYAEAYETMLKHAAWLQREHGVQRNEIVAMDFTNKPQFIWIWFALWSLGAQPAFINCNLRDKAFSHCVRISTARLLLIDANIREVLTDETRQDLGPDDKGRSIDPVVVDDSTTQAILNTTPYRAPNEVRSGVVNSDSAMLIYTSGTTGLPKAAIVSWLKPHSGYYFWKGPMELDATSRYYSPMPLYHSAASILCVTSCIGAGCTYVMGPHFSPKRFMKQVAESKATHMQYIGEMCRYLMSSPSTPYDKAHVCRLAFGNGLRPDVWQPFKDRYGITTIVEFYGATEGPGSSAVNSKNSFTLGSIGKSGLLARALGRSQQAIVKFDHEADAPWRDPKSGLCTRAAHDEPGELMSALDPESIKEKYQGYFGNAKSSDSKILRDVFKKGDAWYRTGDLLRRDAEGRTYFSDRIGDTFRWKSENVSTAEVSEALSTHPAVREANVYGVQLPGHDGRAGCAALLLREGQAMDDALKRDLAAHVRKRLPKYAVPLFLRLVAGELEVTGTIKQTKVKLRNEGVDPAQVCGDEVVWLPKAGEGYKGFGDKGWESLVRGQVRL